MQAACTKELTCAASPTACYGSLLGSSGRKCSRSVPRRVSPGPFGPRALECPRSVLRVLPKFPRRPLSHSRLHDIFFYCIDAGLKGELCKSLSGHHFIKADMQDIRIYLVEVRAPLEELRKERCSRRGQSRKAESNETKRPQST